MSNWVELDGQMDDLASPYSKWMEMDGNGWKWMFDWVA
jgi:hypothetical protein